MEERTAFWGNMQISIQYIPGMLLRELLFQKYFRKSRSF